MTRRWGCPMRLPFCCEEIKRSQNDILLPNTFSATKENTDPEHAPNRCQYHFIYYPKRTFYPSIPSKQIDVLYGRKAEQTHRHNGKQPHHAHCHCGDMGYIAKQRDKHAGAGKDKRCGQKGAGHITKRILLSYCRDSNHSNKSKSTDHTRQKNETPQDPAK